MTLTRLDKAPFPWFGGKADAAEIVWQLLGDVNHYVEPFAGSLAVLLRRPHPCNRPYHSETVNDLDGLLVNVWRSIQWHPEETAEHASWPVTEADKSARQIACLQWRTETNLDRLAGDPRFCDPLVAGWWLYGVCAQIGPFTADGPWIADPVTGRIIKQGHRTREPGVSRNRPHLSNDGRGINRPGTREPGVSRDLPHLSTNGRGINHAGTREPEVGDCPEFHPMTMPELVRWFRWLAARLRHVRIVNGQWTRVLTPAVIRTLNVRQGKGLAGVFLDPPYCTSRRHGGMYQQDTAGLADEVRAWCHTASTQLPDVRIVLAGYGDEHDTLLAQGWTRHEWHTDGWLSGGMGTQSHLERLWASPACVTPAASPQFALWDLP